MVPKMSTLPPSAVSITFIALRIAPASSVKSPVPVRTAMVPPNSSPKSATKLEMSNAPCWSSTKEPPPCGAPASRVPAKPTSPLAAGELDRAGRAGAAADRDQRAGHQLDVAVERGQMHQTARRRDDEGIGRVAEILLIARRRQHRAVADGDRGVGRDVERAGGGADRRAGDVDRVAADRDRGARSAGDLAGGRAGRVGDRHRAGRDQRQAGDGLLLAGGDGKTRSPNERRSGCRAQRRRRRRSNRPGRRGRSRRSASCCRRSRRCAACPRRSRSRPRRG